MKPRLDIYVRKFWINFGWYSGEEFKVFNLSVLKFLTDQHNKIDMIVFWDIQILKFMFACGINF